MELFLGVDVLQQASVIGQECCEACLTVCHDSCRPYVFGYCSGLAQGTAPLRCCIPYPIYARRQNHIAGMLLVKTAVGASQALLEPGHPPTRLFRRCGRACTARATAPSARRSRTSRCSATSCSCAPGCANPHPSLFWILFYQGHPSKLCACHVSRQSPQGPLNLWSQMHALHMGLQLRCSVVLFVCFASPIGSVWWFWWPGSHSHVCLRKDLGITHMVDGCGHAGGRGPAPLLQPCDQPARAAARGAARAQARQGGPTPLGIFLWS